MKAKAAQHNNVNYYRLFVPANLSEVNKHFRDNTDNRGQKIEYGGQRTDNGGQKTEDR